MQEIKEEGFAIALCPYSSSPMIQSGIWLGQHECVKQDIGIDLSCPPDSKAGNAVIKHQLSGDRGHYSVLNMAFVKFHVSGFPHSTIAQITRHRDSAFLVQSGRYTGDRFAEVGRSPFDQTAVEQLFYLRPVSKYRDREGDVFDYTLLDREIDARNIYQACQLYADKRDRGCPFEMAREILPYCFRQDFAIAGTIEAMWHLLDQRSKKDAEREIRILAGMIHAELMAIAPELQTWYGENRLGKAKLAP